MILDPVVTGTVAVIGLALLAGLQLSHVRKVKRQRGALFDRVAHLFEDAEVHQDGIGYPVLTGRYRGCPIKLEPLVDSATFRKLPVLWLVVTHHRPLPVAAPLDVLLRPTGAEFFSPNADFEHDLLPGEDWPEHVRVATPDPSKAPPLSALGPIGSFISDTSTKEVYVARGGVRLVHQLAEGDQAHYRVTRRVELDTSGFGPERLAPVLEALVGIGDELVAARERTGTRGEAG